ncbi:MAG TPA: multiheme c-type cytochrome [Myxococcales bacterium]|nr:multiheme c-type cytochrome [Myxococcales bacterium]
MKRLIPLLLAPAALASDLVGPTSCRTCHAEAYRIWAAGPHARAAANLTPEQRQKAICLQCHSRDEQRAGQAAVEGVSCETCHGGGRYYQPATVMKDKELARLFGLVDPGAQSCMVCHGGTAPSLRAFDVKEAMQRIDHWTAERAARKPKLSFWLRESR